MRPLEETTAHPDCNGICVSAADIGISMHGSMVAYAHPGCPIHGEGEMCQTCEGWGSSYEGGPDAKKCTDCNGTGSVNR